MNAYEGVGDRGTHPSVFIESFLILFDYSATPT